MNKRKFARKLSELHGIPVSRAYEIVDDFRQHILECLLDEQYFVWRGLGTIRVVRHKKRVVRTPTGVHMRRPGAVRSTFQLTDGARAFLERHNSNAEPMHDEIVDTANDQ